jgi:hypothetical protein
MPVLRDFVTTAEPKFAQYAPSSAYRNIPLAEVAPPFRTRLTFS